MKIKWSVVGQALLIQALLGFVTFATTWTTMKVKFQTLAEVVTKLSNTVNDIERWKERQDGIREGIERARSRDRDRSGNWQNRGN